MWLKLVIHILYLPVMISLIGLSWWWFQATESCQVDNPVLFLLWGFVRMLPAIIGLTGIVCGPMLSAAGTQGD